ncbi:hypothetical protein HYV11_02035 [Candidatus Dependentiae bacterium]|nr:hypothetical protein [Candidatus Dependentiae bacterium]
MKKDILAQNDQFIISYELLHVLYWLLKYEEVELSKLINKSFNKGIQEKMQNKNAFSEMQLTEKMQNSIVDFFTFMEQEILDIADQEASKNIHKDAIKDLDHVDPKEIDHSLIKETIVKNLAKLQNKTYNKQTRTLFLKDLLRHWKPAKKALKKSAFIH